MAVSGAGIWLDWQNTAVEPVLCPGIATRTHLLPNVPNDCNMNHRYLSTLRRTGDPMRERGTECAWFADAKIPCSWAWLLD